VVGDECLAIHPATSRCQEAQVTQVFDTTKCLLKFVGTGEKEVVEQAGMWPDRQAWLQATKENTSHADREKMVDIKKDAENKGIIKKEEDKSSTAENLAEIRRKKTLIEGKKKKRFEDSKSSKDIEEKRLNEEYWGRVEEEKQAEEGSIIKPKQSFTKAQAEYHHAPASRHQAPVEYQAPAE